MRETKMKALNGRMALSGLLGVLAAVPACNVLQSGAPQLVAPDARSVTLVLVNETGAPIRADAVFRFKGEEVRRTTRLLAQDGRDASVEVFPTPVETLSIEAHETTNPNNAKSGDTLVQRTLIIGADFTAGETLTFKIRPREIIINRGPTAQTIPEITASPGQIVTLNASASTDPENDALFFKWTQDAGPQVTLSDPNSAITTFVAPQVTTQTTLQFSISVGDGQSDSSASVRVLVVPPPPNNHAPTANAGEDQHVLAGHNVLLDARNSNDSDGDPLTFAWMQVEGPAVMLHHADSAQANFEAPIASEPSTFRFVLTVNDTMQNATDDVIVRVAANQPPVANAGPDKVVLSGGMVMLDGGGSFDPEGFPLKYFWQVGGGGGGGGLHQPGTKGGPSFSLDNPFSPMPILTAPIVPPGGEVNLVFQLTVTDIGLLTASDDMLVRVVGPPPLSIEAGADPSLVAVGRPTVLTANVTGGVPPYEFYWLVDSDPAGGAAGEGAFSARRSAKTMWTGPGGLTGHFVLLVEVYDSQGNSSSYDMSVEVGADCNENGTPDSVDISSGASRDCNSNGIPTECEPPGADCEDPIDQCNPMNGADCNHNNVLDSCDIALGTSQDVNHNGIPDECE